MNESCHRCDEAWARVWPYQRHVVLLILVAQYLAAHQQRRKK